MRWPLVIDHLFLKVDSIRGSVLWLFVVPTIVAALRMAEEELALGTTITTVGFFHYAFAYVVIMLTPICVLTASTGEDHRRFIGAASVGMLLALLPVPLDAVLSAFGIERGESGYVYFVKGLQLDLFSPQQTYGESIVLWMSIAVTGTYAGWRKRSFARAAVAGALMYAGVLGVGWAWPAVSGFLPSLGTAAKRQAEAMSFTGIALIFVLYAALRFSELRRSLSRVNNALIFGLLACVGSRMAGGTWAVSSLKAATMAFAALLVFLSNDYYDRDCDGTCGAVPRPVDAEMNAFLAGLQILVAAQAVLAFGSSSYLVIGALILGLAYHHPAIRTKRLPGAAYVVEGLIAAICFYFGARHRGAVSNGLLAEYVALVFVGFAVGSMAKDWKDVKQDLAAGIPTVYALARGDERKLRRLHRFVCVLFAIALLTPIPVLFGRAGIGTPVLILGTISLIASLALLLVRNRRWAVGLAFLAVNAYLLSLAALTPTAVFNG